MSPTTPNLRVGSRSNSWNKCRRQLISVHKQHKTTHCINILWKRETHAMMSILCTVDMDINSVLACKEQNLFNNVNYSPVPADSWTPWWSTEGSEGRLSWWIQTARPHHHLGKATDLSASRTLAHQTTTSPLKRCTSVLGGSEMTHSTRYIRHKGGEHKDILKRLVHETSLVFSLATRGGYVAHSETKD